MESASTENCRSAGQAAEIPREKGDKTPNDSFFREFQKPNLERNSVNSIQDDDTKQFSANHHLVTDSSRRGF